MLSEIEPRSVRLCVRGEKRQSPNVSMHAIHIPQAIVNDVLKLKSQNSANYYRKFPTDRGVSFV